MTTEKKEIKKLFSTKNVKRIMNKTTEDQIELIRKYLR